MRPDDVHGETFLYELRGLRAYDVSAVRAERLRSRCHRGLEIPRPPRQVKPPRDASVWRRWRIVAVGYCALYLFETLRRAAAVYGF